MAKIFDIRPDKNLLDSRFDGYKLSLEKLPIYQRNLSEIPEHNSPSEDQYSLQHARVFSSHNHLFVDPWCHDSATFVSGNGQVWFTCWSEESRDLDALCHVWTIPSSSKSRKGSFNPCLSFCGERNALVSDGHGTLYIVETGNRKERTRWQVAYTKEVFDSKVPFSILGSLFCEGGRQLHCLLLTVEEVGKDESRIGDTAGLFVSVIHWIIMQKDDNGNWQINRQIKFSSTSYFEYVSLAESGQAVYVVSGGRISTGEEIKQVDKEENIEHLAEERSSAGIYSWMQTECNVTIWLKLPPEILNKDDVTVVTSKNEIKIEIKGQPAPILNGWFGKPVKADETVWSVDEKNHRLQVKATKCEENIDWQDAVVLVEEDMDSQLVQEAHATLQHLCSEDMNPNPDQLLDQPAFNVGELEACDAMPDQLTFYRLILHEEKSRITHKASLSSHKVLFTTTLPDTPASSICLRYDVDGLLFNPSSAAEETEESFQCQHVSTFPALGYVQASKQQRFTLCSPDLTYAAICDVRKHVHVYRRPTTLDCELRNRHTGRKISHVAKQQVIGLEPPEEIFGAKACLGGALYLITPTKLLRVQVE